VDEQSTASKEIAANLSHASQGMTEVNHNVISSSSVISGISIEIQTINRNSIEVNEGSRQVQDSAKVLTSLATQLEALVQKFKV
jgi:methyl-accepting chemotaxis protein